MKIFAISVIKNEADVIQHNLRQAAVWADKIFVLDNGSTDGTWEKVQIQRRADTRIQARKDGFTGWYHAANPNWRDYMRDDEELFEDSGNGVWQSQGNVNEVGHKWYALLVKTVMHGLNI